MKIAVIGGGSTYTPELIHGLLLWQNAPLKTIALEDINPERLSITAGYCRALARAIDSTVEIVETLNLDEALKGADFIITQIRVGGNQRRALDEKNALELGWLGQETTGAVGFLKAYRTIPVMLDIVKKIQEICPKAFLINFTNPAGIISSAIHRHSGKKNLVGLCNVPIFLHKNISAIMEKFLPDPARLISGKKENLKLPEPCRKGLFLLWGGLNHLTWVFDILWNGVSIKEEVMETVTSLQFDPTPYFPMNREYMKKTMTITSPYLRYFTDTEEVIEEFRKKRPRGEEVMEIEKNLFRIYREEMENLKPGAYSYNNPPLLPEELSKRGGADYSRLAVKLIMDMAGESCGEESVHILNVPDREGFFVEKGDFCEIPVIPSSNATHSTNDSFFYPVYPDRSLIHGEITELIHRVKSYENLTIQAAVSQNTSVAVEALLSNPLVEGEDKVREFINKSLNK